MVSGLTWLAPFEGVLNDWLAPADQIAEATPLTRLKGRPIAWQDWAWDGRPTSATCPGIHAGG
jgi:hypothetical protein